MGLEMTIEMKDSHLPRMGAGSRAPEEISWFMMEDLPIVPAMMTGFEGEEERRVGPVKVSGGPRVYCHFPLLVFSSVADDEGEHLH
jgi:hypothetical protein